MKYKLKHKIISIFILIVFSVSLLPQSLVFAGNNETDSMAYSNACEVLKGLEVYRDFDFEYAKGSFVRRDIYAEFLMKIMGLSEISGGISLDLVDVSDKTYMSDAIQTLLALGIIDEKAKGFFSPESFLTYDDAIKSIVRLLGYGSLMDARNSSNSDYTLQAKKLGLLNDVSFTKDNRIQFDALTIMLYNALEIKTLVQDKYGNNRHYKTSDEALLESVFDLKKIEGVVSSTDYTSLDFEEPVKDRVKINGIYYHVGDTNAQEFLGYNCDVYYHDDGNINTIKIIRCSLKNKILELNTTDIEYEDYVYKYNISGREKKVKISNVFNLIINGEASVYDKNKMIPLCGTITLVNTDDDSLYDNVIIRFEENFVVKECNPNDKLIAFKDKTAIDLSGYADEDILIFNDDGKEISLRYIMPNSVVTIVRNSLCAKIYLSNKKIYGFVNSVKNTTPTEIIIDAAEFIVTNDYNDTAIEAGLEGNFLLNIYGEVVGYVESDLLWNVGWIIDVSRTKKLEDDYKLKILSEDSKIEIISLEDKVTIDESKFKISDQSIDSILSKGQLMRYKINSKGKISSVDTCNGDDGIKTIGQSSVSDGKYRKGQFGEKICISPETKIFMTPSANDNINDDSYYKIGNMTDFVDDNYYEVTAYSLKESKIVASYISVKRNVSNYSFNDRTLVVKDVVQILSDEGEVLYKVTLIASNKENIYYADINNEYVKDIGEGDVVRMRLNGDKIDTVEKIYDYDADIFDTTYQNRDFINNNNKIFKAYVYNKDGKFIKVSESPTSDENSINLNADGATIVIVDSSKKNVKVSLGTVDDICDYYSYGVTSMVIAFSSYMTTYGIYIYK